MQMGTRKVLMTKGRQRRRVNIWTGNAAERTKNRITDENVTGILALGGKDSHSSHALVVKVRIGKKEEEKEKCHEKQFL